MVTPIQILVIFYPKGFENQDLFDRSVVDDNTWFLRYVRYSLLEPNIRRNSVFSYYHELVSDKTNIDLIQIIFDN